MFRRLYTNVSQRIGLGLAATESSVKSSGANKSSERFYSNETPAPAAAPQQTVSITNPNKRHPCGSILSANENYSHWYAHRYGIPHRNQSLACSDSANHRDLERLMQLQHTNPNVHLFPFLGMDECLASDTAMEGTHGKDLKGSVKEENVAKACSMNENHAHWFKQQYCMVPDWEVDCFQHKRSRKGYNGSGVHQAKIGEKAVVDPIEAHPQPRRDIRSFDFSVRIQHAHLDTREASKLFNIS
eukprot:GILI01003826.1.p1 GENE.GILI01003826.1~~GILI01003826.1.p1  ORF type:complete len:243 (+),score=69.55 GILI01003826.1:86-814(+)